jgi:pimeloyl-ACP methyl ester carboxylesterase
MAGQLIDVGGHRLHLNCTGTGSPTVVLEPGGGEMSSNLGWITPGIARVCVYDRAGRGWSDSAETPQDGVQIATDLHTLLHRGHVPGPYVLAGHSFGGLYVLAFAARYPGEVAGLVLIDSTAPKPATTGSPADRGSYDAIGRLSALASTPARLGLGRLYAQVAVDTLPSRSAAEVRASVATASNLRSTIDEYVQASTSVHQAAALTNVGDKPLLVLTAANGHDAAWPLCPPTARTASSPAPPTKGWSQRREGLVAEKKYAAATTQAILDVVSAVRSQRPLVK